MHQLHYVLLAFDAAFENASDLYDAALSEIEGYRDEAFDYCDGGQGLFAHAHEVGYRRNKELFLRVLAEIRDGQRARAIDHLRYAIRIPFEDTVTTTALVAKATAELVHWLDTGFYACKQIPAHGNNPSYYLNIALNLAQGMYCFDSGFFDARTKTAVVPNEQELDAWLQDMPESEDLFLVPLDLHY